MEAQGAPRVSENLRDDSQLNDELYQETVHASNSCCASYLKWFLQDFQPRDHFIFRETPQTWLATIQTPSGLRPRLFFIRPFKNRAFLWSVSNQFEKRKRKRNIFTPSTRDTVHTFSSAAAVKISALKGVQIETSHV